MAQPRWNNIQAPRMTDVSSIFNNAAASFNQGFNGINAQIEDKRVRDAETASNGLIPELARGRTEASFNDFLDNSLSNLDPSQMTPELRELVMQRRGTLMDYDTRRLQDTHQIASTNSVNSAAQLARNADGRADTLHNRGIAREDQLAGMTGGLIGMREDAYGGNITRDAPASLVRTESGGRFDARNNAEGSSGRRGHYGRVQFGQDRFDEAVAAGAVPQGMTIEEFGSDTPEGRAAQESAENWHFGTIQSEIDKRGLEQYVGKTINGVEITRDGIVAMAHLGGIGGATQFLTSNGQYDPDDDKNGDGTKLSDYARTHAGNTTARTGSVADLIPEGSLIRPSDLLGIVDGNYNAFNTGEVDRDQNRDRDFNFDNSSFNEDRRRNELAVSDQEALDRQAADEAAKAAARELSLSVNSSEAARQAIFNNESLSFDQVQDQTAAVDALNINERASSVPDLTSTGSDFDTSVAQVVADTYINQNNAALGNHEVARINRLAANVGDDPAQYILDKVPNIDMQRGEILTTLNKIVDGAAAQGVRISPEEAAILMSENTKEQSFWGGIGWGNGGWGDIRVNDDNAVETAINTFSEEGRRTATELESRVAQDNAVVQNAMSRMAEISGEITSREQRGMDTTELQTAREELRSMVENINKTNPALETDVGNFNARSVVNPTPVNTGTARRNNRTGRDANTQSPELLAVASDYINRDGRIGRAMSDPNTPPAQKVQMVDQLIENAQNDVSLTSAQKQEVIEGLNAVKSNFTSQ